MYRVINMSGTYYGLEIDTVDEDVENIEQFANEGTPVIIVSDIEDLSSLGIYSNIIMVDRNGS